MENFEKNLVSAGYSLTPLHPNSKVPILNGWNAREPSTAEEVEGWRKSFPGCNFGVRTDGLFIIDVDQRGLGWLEDNKWLTDEEPMMVKTKNGWHLYFQTEDDHRQSSLAPGVDVRACGKGQVVAPNSTVCGWTYKALRLIGKDDLPAVPNSLFLLHSAGEESSAARNGGLAPRGEKRTLKKELREGERNRELTRVAGVLFKFLYDEMDWEFLLIVLHDWNRYLCKPPLADGEVNVIAKSIYNRETEIRNKAKAMFAGMSRPAHRRRLVADAEDSSQRVSGASPQSQ